MNEEIVMSHAEIERLKELYPEELAIRIATHTPIEGWEQSDRGWWYAFVGNACCPHRHRSDKAAERCLNAIRDLLKGK